MKKQHMDKVEEIAKMDIDNLIEAVEIAATITPTPLDDMAVGALKDSFRKILNDLADKISE